jgi:uncharacterized protein (DUF305 family)
MKTTFSKLLLLFPLIVALQSCEKDEGKISIQAHDQNQMMTLMHQMMEKMMDMPMTQDPDTDFAMMMRIHHKGAIDMANLELTNGTDGQLKAMAQKIIEDQQQEITELTAFLDAHAPHLSVPEFSTMQMRNMEKGGRNADLQIINGNTDHDFATLMINHHQTAIENGRLELLYGHDTGMRDMAARMIEAQENEIKTLQEWLLNNRDN